MRHGPQKRPAHGLSRFYKLRCGSVSVNEPRKGPKCTNHCGVFVSVCGTELQASELDWLQHTRGSTGGIGRGWAVLGHSLRLHSHQHLLASVADVAGPDPRRIHHQTPSLLAHQQRAFVRPSPVQHARRLAVHSRHRLRRVKHHLQQHR
jgi:hypothetical protein